VSLPARTAKEALEEYRVLNQVPLSCVHRKAFWRFPNPSRPVLEITPSVLRLTAARCNPVYVSALQEVEPVEREEGWGIKVLRYSYIVSPSERMKPELVAWQWHPEITNIHGEEETCPHVHLGWPCCTVKSFHKLLVPTSRVGFEHVAWFLLNQLQVEALRRFDMKVLVLPGQYE
jgi:hypothetical protein